MSRVYKVRVDTCDECPAMCDTIYPNRCSASGNRQILEYGVFPTWCPLEEYSIKEKEERK